MGAFDLYDQVGFYAEYHHNPVNKWIHIICVPMILFTAQVWLTYTGPLTSALSFLPVPANLAFFITIFYVFYYIVLEPVAGLLEAPFLLTSLYFANVFATNVQNATLVALGIHVFSWVAQFVGHGVFEKRAPALLDSLIQALLLAPLFVFLEVLFMLGYKPEVHKKLEAETVKRIAEWKSRTKRG